MMKAVLGKPGTHTKDSKEWESSAWAFWCMVQIEMRMRMKETIARE